MSVDRSVAWELAALGGAAAVFVASFQVRPRYLDFVLAALAVGLVAATSGRSRKLWALERSPDPNGRGAWAATLAFTAAALAALAGAAVLAARSDAAPLLPRLTNANALAVVGVYFLWALVQQYLFQSYLFGRWLRVAPLPLAVALTALAFAAVHFPRWPVMAVTLVSGAVWALIYYRWRRLVPLAVSHALLGTALHYWVFGTDLLARWWP